MRVGQGVAEGIHLLKSELSGNNFSWNKGKVPGDVYTDLYLAGELDDPYFGRNMHKAKWVQEYEWWYNYAFNLDQSFGGKNITLVFEGVDYSCEVWFNQEYLGKHEGMFSSFEFDITDLVDWTSPHVPVNLLTVKLDPPPKNQQNFAGLKHNFAGDYLTGLIPFGIWRPVKIIGTEKVKIDNYRIEYELDGKRVNTSLKVNINAFHSIKNAEVVVKYLDNNEIIKEVKEPIKFNRGHHTTAIMEFALEEPKLWWPVGMGEQFLYDIEISVVEEGRVLDNITDKTGVRTVKYTFNPGFTQEEVEFPWTLNVNDKPMFMRSACWTQPSFFYGRNSIEKYESFLLKAKEANINNLRFFAWHPIETKEFYDICDRLGITVWTNFAFATQEFRSDKVYLDKVKREVRSIVRERRNHPSTVMWMGGEEVYFTEAHVHSRNRELMEMIGHTISDLTSVHYADASPLSSREGIRMGYKPNESLHANGHYYAAGAIFMEDFYPKLHAAVIPELTAASAPNVESLKKFIPENELWPMGLSWGYHMADINVLQNLNYEVHGSTGMDSLEEFVEYTQIAQGTVAQFALEHFRRQKPHVSAVALCHFNTNWPIIKWDIVDYYGVKKRSFDYVKRAYNPILPSLEFAKRRYNNGEEFVGTMYVINDYYKKYNDVDLEYKVLNNDRNEFKSGSIKIDVGENVSTPYTKIEFEVPADWKGFFYIQLALKQNGELIIDNEYRLLVDDQEKAKAVAKQMYLDMHKYRKEFGKGYYRYYPNILDEL
ncbi:glycoside hydrolase family 2 [Candidatus Epulonipiscioides gigas]|nr:glycoside hydrolase family 2 [Epulopiscium sp. SCG-C07WGA-EpuloA2]ONI44862.1 glycoside hydrolase family 2 [Epulopiscium sp. SCG-C07WGA-EpuloA2]